MGFKQNNCQTFLKVLECYCKMSAIAVGYQRETVKDMVIAGYQVPNGGRFVQIILNLENNLERQLCLF